MKIRSVAVELFHTAHAQFSALHCERVEEWLNVTMEDICLTGNDIPQTEIAIQYNSINTDSGYPARQLSGSACLLG